jgi:hypothetical protein
MRTGVKVNGFHFYKNTDKAIKNTHCETLQKRVKVRAIYERSAKSCKVVCMETYSHLILQLRYQISATQQPKTSLARFTVEVCRSHMI